MCYIFENEGNIHVLVNGISNVAIPHCLDGRTDIPSKAGASYDLAQAVYVGINW